MIYLFADRHEILAQNGVELPFAGKFLYDLCKWRDREVTWIKKVKTQVALAFITLLAIVEAVVRLPLSLFAALLREEKWAQGYVTSCIASIHGTYGLFINLFVNKLSLPLIDFSIKALPCHVQNGLIESCTTGNKVLVKKYLDQKADPHKVSTLGITPAMLSRLFGQPHLNEVMSLNTYENKYLEIKELSHWFSLKGEETVEGQKINFEGIPSLWMFEVLRKNLEAYFKEMTGYHSLTKEKQKMLLEALDLAYRERSYKAIANRIQEGKLTFLATGWKGHAICLCFYQNQFSIVNTGPRPQDISNLVAYKADFSTITPELIEEILTYQYLPMKTSLFYFYHTLIRKIKGVKDPLSQSLKIVAPSDQKAGVCGLSSKKGALRFAWPLLLSPSPNQKILNTGRREAKRFIDWSAVETFNRVNPSERITQLCAAKAKRKASRINSSFFLNFIKG